MPTPNPTRIVVPVFAGQGSPKTSLEQVADLAVRDAKSPLGLLLLSSCRDAFLEELSALSPEELDQSGLVSSDFADPLSFLSPQPKYAKNQIISGISLFVVQVLRYQSYAQATSPSYLDLLKSNIDHGIGILGLSSGIFPACAVAASQNPLTYITTSVEIFRLVFWIGLRLLQFTRKLLKEKSVDSTLSWSVACLGLTKAEIEEQIVAFEEKHRPTPSLRVTAVLDERNVTVSGRPDVLDAFSTLASQSCTVHPITIDALYHSDLHLLDSRDKILADVARRNIRFPDYDDLHCPLRSTISGKIVRRCGDYPSLLPLVVDMVLVHPVNWDLVAKEVAFTISPEMEFLAVNIGPGSSTLRALERVFPEHVLYCVDSTSDSRAEATAVPPKQEPIAIIGMAAHAPGAANTSELWEILEKGISTVSKIPEDRFSVPVDTGHEVGTSSHEMKVKTGNFMNDYADFDHKFFKISPREARSMDPQQRVLLHTAYEALENAGYVPDATPCFRRETFGCYIGAATQDYAGNLDSNIDIHYSTGTLRAFLSGRISYFMQFGGPSVVMDTACSSSTVAIYQACRALMNKDCNAALAGGVNIMSCPNMFIGLERGHFLSTSGQCKTFDASADGYSRGEGCCLFVLKRLRDAVEENDNIIGVIRGVEVNQSGLAPSITHPHAPTQANLLATLLENSGVSPSRVSVVEAHGTGTEAGDSSELACIRSVLSSGRTRDNPLHVTSIKANIGHLEAASGAISLCKLLLMLRHNVIPAQISLKTLHPLIAPLGIDNLVINTLPSPWSTESSPRIALLNNFGAAGSNGALLLEEYIKPAPQPTVPSAFVFGVSAKSPGALKNMRSRYMQWLLDTGNHEIPFCDVAYTATARRQLYPFRLSVVAGDKGQLIRDLPSASITHVERREDQLIFVYSGQGSQYVDMGALLYATSAVFKNCIDRCHGYLVSLGYPGILPIISSESCDYALGPDEEFEAYQSAILAVEFALTSLWRHWGVVPTAVIGQSLGEYAAMVAANVLTIETALSIVAKRARLMVQSPGFRKTTMLAISIPSLEVQEMLETHDAFSNVTVACINTDSSCVVAGPQDGIQALSTHLSTTVGCKTVGLGMPIGFHSAAMDPILRDLRDHVASLPIHPPSIPIASNVSGTVIPPGDGAIFQADYFIQHCRQPVLFARGLRALEKYVDPARIDAWIDLGPHPICLPMIEATLSPSSDTLCLPSMLRDTSPWNTLSQSLAQLYRSAVPVDWRRVFAERSACSCVELPSYPFESQKFWVPHKTRASLSAPPEITLLRQPPNHPMLSSWAQYPSRQNGNAAIFETPIGRLAAYIEGHKVGGYALCPASVYLEQALAGAVIAQRYLDLDFGRCMPVLRSIEFSRPLVLSPDIQLIVRTHVTIHEDGTGTFSIASRLESSREEHVHVHGNLRFSSTRETTSKLALELPGFSQRAEPATEDKAPEVFSTHTAYEVVFPRVVEYAKDYHTIQSLTVSGDGASGVARIVFSGASSLAIQPLFLDTLLHAAGFIANMRGDVSDAYICSDIGSLQMLCDLINAKPPYTVYCSSNWISSPDFVVTDILAVQDGDPQVVVAHLQGVQFRRVRLRSLHRGLALAADPGGPKVRKRTDSNAIITPSSPRSIIFARSRSNTLTTHAFGGELRRSDVDNEEGFTLFSEPTSPLTLVSEGDPFSRTNLEIEEQRIRTIIAEVLGLANSDDVGVNVDFRSLGLDSLGSIEAQQALRVALNRPIPHNIFARCPTLSSLCELLIDGWADGKGADRDIQPPGDPSPERLRNHSDVALVHLQQFQDEGDSKTPLYLVHDGSGLISNYERILPLHRDVWGISNPRFFSDEPWESLEDMARSYALAIQDHAGDELILGGWSFGGVVAFEVAGILASRGVKVKGVVLIDSPAPGPSSPTLLSDAMINHIVREQEYSPGSSMTQVILAQFKSSTQLLENFVSRKQDTSIPLAFLRSTSGFHPPSLNTEEIPSWFRERAEAGPIVGPWEALVGPSIHVFDIPGNHFEPFGPAHIKATSAQLDRACQYLETT